MIGAASNHKNYNTGAKQPSWKNLLRPSSHTPFVSFSELITKLISMVLNRIQIELLPLTYIDISLKQSQGTRCHRFLPNPRIYRNESHRQHCSRMRQRKHTLYTTYVQIQTGILMLHFYNSHKYEIQNHILISTVIIIAQEACADIIALTLIVFFKFCLYGKL